MSFLQIFAIILIGYARSLLIKNNKEGIKNQTLEYNIGCHVEGDISHYIKAVKGGVQKYIVKKHLSIC